MLVWDEVDGEVYEKKLGLGIQRNLLVCGFSSSRTTRSTRLGSETSKHGAAHVFHAVHGCATSCSAPLTTSTRVLMATRGRAQVWTTPKRWAFTTSISRFLCHFSTFLVDDGCRWKGNFPHYQVQYIV